MNAYAEHLTYDDVWDAYCAGMVSTTTLVEMMRRDEVFAAWCKRRVQQIRKKVEQANKAETTA